MFEEFKKERDKEDADKRNKAFAIKERRKNGFYKRGETDFSSSYGVKPWGDEKIKEEEKKKEELEQKKKEAIKKTKSEF